MNPTTLTYDRLRERLAAWTEIRLDIRAAMVVGSRAIVDCPADEWSDLDIILIVADPQRYLTSADWLPNIADFWITYVEPTAVGGELERRVLFIEGLDVDFSIISSAKIEQMVQHGIPSEIAQVFGQGMRVLLDRDGWASCRHPPQTQSAPPRSLTETEFVEAINDFWYHAVWTAKKLRRGQLWTASASA